MKLVGQTKKKYMGAVAEKLRRSEKYLRHGSDGNAQIELRDDMGIQQTFSNVLEVADTFYEITKGQDGVVGLMNNFSSAGLSDVSDVQTIGAIDVTIVTLANSLVPFLCVDRAMSNPVDTIYYQNLVAVNSAGGVTEGDIVSDNFANPNSDVTLNGSALSGNVTGAGAPIALDIGGFITPGTVAITFTPDGGSPIVGRDLAANGIIYFAGGSAPVLTVNYTTGVISSAGNIALNDVVAAVAVEDSGSDSTGAGILKVKADLVPTQLETAPKQLILESNAQAAAYMGKIMKNASRVGGATDYVSLQFQKVSNTYTEDVNRDIIRNLVAMAAGLGGNVQALDLSTYGGGQFVATKNDLVNRFIIAMRTNFLSRTGIQPTVIITSTKGTAELESNKESFVKSPNFYGTMNGLAGTFDGVPVFRHNYLDQIEGGSTATFYMGSKLPDNQSGSMAFGEYLPLTQTGTVGNFNNPIMNSTGFFSQVGVKTIQASLVAKGVITLV
jgi:hypothetical protein